MLTGIPKKEKLDMISVLMNNEKENDLSELNNMASLIAIKMFHRFKNINEGEYYIDEVCKKAKELYKDNVTHNQGKFVEESLLY